MGPEGRCRAPRGGYGADHYTKSPLHPAGPGNGEGMLRAGHRKALSGDAQLRGKRRLALANKGCEGDALWPPGFAFFFTTGRADILKGFSV